MDENAEPADGDEGTATTGNGLPWDGTDRDYTYEELLGAAVLLQYHRHNAARPQTAHLHCCGKTTRCSRVASAARP